MSRRQLAYQPTTGQPCGCRRGIERDNCPACEGTGRRIDFAAIRARPPVAVPVSAIIPDACECDNTHEAVNTVCRWCWWHGRRNWADPEVTHAGESCGWCERPAPC